MREMYDAEIAYVDRELGRLVEAARSTAPAGGLLIVVTSDHGEPMGDHGHFWVRDLYDATLHVPLIVAPASLAHAAPRVVEEDVRLVDLAPTLLALAGAPALSGIDGRSLAPLVAGESEAEPREVIAVSEPEPDEFAGRAAAIRRAGWKLIRMAADLDAPGRWSDAREDLFDVATDPAETANLAATRADVVAELAPRLPKGWSAPAAATITPEERERLRELGYLQ
jgi:arylsulfatase A-like enzyme